MSEIRITPADPLNVGPVAYRSVPNPPFVMPKALVEDAEATAAAAEQEQSWEEWLVDQGIGLIPIVGSGRDAYRAYMAGNNIGLAFNLGMLVVDVLTLGGGTAAKAAGKSTIRAGKATMGVVAKAFRSNVDDAVKLAGKNVDNVGRGMIDNAAGGAGKIAPTSTGGRNWTWGYDKIGDNVAEGAYQAIRESTTDVAAISRYTGYKPDRLQRIKNYLFNNREWTGADGEIAAAWHRLRTGRGTAIDKLLLKHETAEMWFRRNVLDNYTAGHLRANQRYNWQAIIEAVEN